MAKALLAAALIWLVWRWLKSLTGPRSKAGPRGAATARLVADEGEARAILGVDARADEATIRAAHRRLVLSVHPDRGGSAELARRVNAARDLLLRDPR